MKKRVKQYLNRRSLSWKLFSITFFGVLLPVFVLLSYFSYQTYYDTKEQLDLVMDATIENVSFNLKKTFDDAFQISYRFVNDADLNVVVTLDEKDERTLDRLSNIEKNMTAEVIQTPFVKNIFVYISNTKLNHQNDIFIPYTFVRTEPWYLKAQKNPQVVNVLTDIEDGNIDLLMVKNLTAVDFENKSILALDLDVELFYEILHDSVFDELNGVAYLVNNDGEIVGSSEPIYRVEDNTFKLISDVELERGDSMIETSLDDALYLSDWKLVFVFKNVTIIDEFISQIGVMFLVGFVSVLLLTMLSYYVSRSITSRLKTVNKFMSYTNQGILEVIEEDFGTDEIAEVANHFNDMVNEVQMLLDQVNNEKSINEQLLFEKTKAYEEVKVSLRKIQEQNQQIYELVYIDALTGLFNRYAISEKIEEYTTLDQPMALMFLDVDNFKFINDTYGHDVGDYVIKLTADRLKKYESDDVEIGRFGGDEFLVVFKNYESVTKVSHIANSIRTEFDSPLLVEDKKFYLTLSIGVSLYKEHATEKFDLVKKADLALYESKTHGRNLVTIFDNSMNDEIEQKLIFQNAIKEAFTNKEFYMNYQPYFDTQTKEIIGFEALIRWYSDTYGQVSPFELIKNIEEMGLMIDVGNWVLEESIKFSKKANEFKNDVFVSINISIIQLTNPDFYQSVIDVVKAYDVNPNYIVLEMTETIMLESIDHGRHIVKSLRDYGFGIALDDFGTGYSSLRYLKSLPVSVLKIDRAFISSLAVDSYDTDLVQIIMTVSKNRKIKVVAEGVEIQEQYDILKSFDCDIIQGYYLSYPLSESDALKRLL